ncbi:helix-turn-helix domain-containing protein [Candidatus Dojkabacteria bacterium]|nr:helix-turn-helix domain-containing protein [Candidatus Dojkabacteria bacterium]
MKNYRLGEKIKIYRKRAKLSQMDLELEIEASPGSISRIETGKVNPTKETLLKIIDCLDLNALEIAQLYNLNQKKLAKILEVSKNFMSSLRLEKVLQDSVNEIAYELNLLGALIDIKKEDRVWGQTFTQTWYTSLAMKVMPTAFNKLNVAIKDAKENYMIRAILEQRTFLSTDLSDIAVPFVTPRVSKLLEKVSTVKSGIIFPIISRNGNSLGAIYFGKNYIDDFQAEYKILEIFTDTLATAIDNAKKYEDLKNELKNYQDKQ